MMSVFATGDGWDGYERGAHTGVQPGEVRETLLSPPNYVWLTAGKRRARKDMKESAVYSSHSVVL
jgi:hypothetical protein